MLEWVISLLVFLGLAAGGVAGVTTAVSHQGQPAADHATVLEQTDAAPADAASVLEDLITMISDKLSAAAAQAGAHAQDALADAADAAANGLSTASEAVTNAGAPARPAGRRSTERYPAGRYARPGGPTCRATERSSRP
jgi:hypothetical protein